MAGVVGCRSTPAPNIVLITVDTLRADHLAPYGYRGVKTPALSRLARESVLFENAFADVTWTVPSLSSVMTGKYATAHHVRTWYDRLDAAQTTIAELLRARGYRTSAIVGSYALDHGFGLNQGFTDYDDKMNTSMLGKRCAGGANAKLFDGGRKARARWIQARACSDAYRPDDQVADRAIAWITAEHEEPFFLWVHFFGPHERGERGNLLTEERRRNLERRQIEAYDPAVVFMDAQVGRLLDRIRSHPHYENTAIVFHSDHGQSLNEHGFFGHGFDLYDTCAHIPLMVRLPGGRRAGERVARLVRNLDIFAAILHLGGIPVPAEVDSRDLLRQSATQHESVYMETYHLQRLAAHTAAVRGKEVRVGPVLRGLRTAEWKLVVSELGLVRPVVGMRRLPSAFVRKFRKTQLFFIPRDPAERINRAPGEAERVWKMLAVITQRSAGGVVGGRPERELDESAKERLRALGYLP